MSNITLGLLVGAAGLVVMLAGMFWSRRQRMKPEPAQPEEINVGITSARLILQADSDATLTVPGQRFISKGQQYAITSDALFDDLIREMWIPVDDGRVLNRNSVARIIDRKKKEFYL